MININIKNQNGIYNEYKLIDAFIVNDNLSLVFLFNNEKENDLFKLYVGKYTDNVISGISEEEWNIAKEAMSSIAADPNKYQVIKLPDFVDSNGELKPCLIASISFFERHYIIKEEKEEVTNSPIDESKFRFSGNDDWKNSIKSEEIDKDEKDNGSVDSIIDEANNIKLDDEQYDEKLIESTDYKGQKENFVNLMSRALDEIMETKNKELVDMANQMEELERELRKSELEKKQALNIIDMYHEKIQKLSVAIRESNGENNGN